MDWIKAAIHTASDDVESVLGVLLAHGVSGAEIKDTADLKRILLDNPLSWDYVDEALLADDSPDATVTFYVSPDDEGRETLRRVGEGLRGLSLSLACETVSDETWLHEWKKYFKPLRLGKRVVIVPGWETYDEQPGDVVCLIDPGSVFGTGQHQSTQLCAEALEKYLRPGDALLDVGCGSGILSLVGLLLGAGRVWACDIDPAALTSVRGNAALNALPMSRLRVQIADIFADENFRREIAAQPFDMLAANIVADPVIRLTGMAADLLRPGGLFIASGIITERIAEVEAAVTAAGMTLVETASRDGWYAVVGKCHA